MIRLGKGKASFAEFAENNLYYVDRTQYIEVLETLESDYNVFLRPRRFGKSLWISTLKYYYGIQHKDKFQFLFGKYYIGKNPTPLANQFLVLHFNFSGIDTENKTILKEAFYNSVYNSVLSFLYEYGTLLSENEKERILSRKGAEAIIGTLFTVLSKQAHKVYLLIDEYDHFTNELLSFNFTAFQDIVTKNGWLRKFFEVFKNAANEGVIARIFITGVSPVTIDSMTSGFNITTNLTIDARFHNLMGFTFEEVDDLFEGIEMKPEHKAESLQIAKEWYNGYLFTEGIAARLYNPNMIIFYAFSYLERNQIPRNFLDTNIATDYKKVKGLFMIHNKEKENIAALETLLEEGEITIPLTLSYQFEMGFTHEDFVSLLFYTGFLTLKEITFLGESVLEIPNRVIKELYLEYFRRIIAEEANYNQDFTTLRVGIKALLLENKPHLLAEHLAKTLKALSVRDKRTMTEKSVQVLFFSYLNMIKEYTVKSEYEENGQYYDIFMRKNGLATAFFKYEFLFEFKYIKKAGDVAVGSLDKSTILQVKRYLNQPELQKHPDLHAWRIIFVKDELKVCEEVEYEVV